MNWSASVLSTISSDTEPTIVLAFDSAKYIFNTGENTNRAFLQSKRNWKRTRGLFFTHVGTQRTGGLPGLLMSFADATIPRLDIVGPPGITHFLAAMRSYTFRDTMPIYPTEASWTASTSLPPSALYQDDNITVYGIPVIPSSDKEHRLPSSASEPLSTTPPPELPLKRKRGPSPELRTKRPHPATDTSKPSRPISLSDLMKGPDFSPQKLDGETAREWRALMIRTMFPGSRNKSEKSASPKRMSPKEKKTSGKSSQAKLDSSSSRGRRLSSGGSESGTKPGAVDAVATHHTSTTVGVDLISDQDTGDAPSQSKPSNIDIYKRARLPPGFHLQLPTFTSSILTTFPEPHLAPTLGYIVVGPRVRGKFDVKKAEALGVPFGPKRGQLTKGQAITFNVKVGDETVERVVRPEECVGESEAPVAVLVLDIPTPMHIPSLVSSFDTSPFYAQFRSNKPEDLKEYAVRSVFHICGDGVLEDERYVTFMNGFAPGTHHIVASREYGPDPVTFTSAAFNQLRLNQLDSTIFPLPKFSMTPKKDIATVPNLPATTCLMSSNQLNNMRPPAAPTTATPADAGDLFHPAVTSLSPISLPSLTTERFAEARANVEENIRSGKVHVPNGADVNVIPLGTGSAVPSKYRNVSSTLIQIPKWGNVLLDAGEGTWGQLVRQFGLDDSSSPNIWQTLRNLKCVFISHIHGDHHMGIAQILAKRRMLDPPPSEPLYLVTIRAVHLYLRELSDLQDLGLNDPSGNGVITIMSEALHWRKTGAYQTSGMWQVGGDESWTDFQQSQRHSVEMCHRLGLESFHTVDVYHRTRCYGAVIKHSDGWSIVFSGDTQPTNSLVWAGRDATLLIHEATMADDQSDMAQRKAHSTFGQALDIGKRMNAENILLTHFSARYPKMPPSGVTAATSVEEGFRRKKAPIVALAFDHANLSIGDMWKLNYYLPAVEQSFRDTVEEDDNEDADITASMDVDLS